MAGNRRGRECGFTGRAGVSLLTLVAFLPLAVGCTSNEYVIPHEELARLAAAPAPQRGGRVRVLQELGGRRGEPVPPVVTVPARLQPEPQQGDDEVADQTEAGDTDGSNLNVQIDVDAEQGQARRRRGSGGGGNGSWSPGGRSATGGGRAAPPSGPSSGGGHVGSGGHVHVGGGGGGGGGNGDAIIVAVIVIVAVAVAIGLVSSEGVRFDGYVAMSPAQPVHLKDARGGEATIPIAELSPDLVAVTVEARVMDDEGYGIERLDRVPLDRRGGTFKLDSGTIAFDVAGATAVGPAMNIQAGYFFTRKVGLLANVGLGGGGVPQGLVPRHALALELQAFPVGWGPFHLGAFGNGGMAITEVLVGTTPTYVSGPSVGGGALAELDLTSRLALTLRAGASLSKLDQLWSSAGMLTAGVAVY
ncbi:MAG TPA: hypothetical protein VI456_16315 [Polyangia bacterium]